MLIPPIKPITPDEAYEQRLKSVHPGIIDVVNTILKREFVSHNSVIIIRQDDIIQAFLATHSSTRQEIFDNKWLDFESIYKDAGWHVLYDKPGYNESYSAYFKFSKKKE